MASCWMVVPWLPTVLDMLEDIPWSCPVIKDLIVDISVWQVLKGLSYLHLTLWLLRDMCYADKGSLPQSLRQLRGKLRYLQQYSTSNVGKNQQVGVLEKVYPRMPYLHLK